MEPQQQDQDDSIRLKSGEKLEDWADKEHQKSLDEISRVNEEEENDLEKFEEDTESYYENYRDNLL